MTSESPAYYTIIWMCYGQIVAGLFTLATLIVYSIVPEVKNLQGSLIRQYLASYLGYRMMDLLYFFLSSHESHSEDLVVADWFGLLMLFFHAAAMLWLSIMSFDIWRTFRQMSPSRDLNAKFCGNRKLVPYSIYAWGIPFVITACFALWMYTFEFHVNESGTMFWVMKVSIPVGVTISNTFFYVLTALTIRKRKKETAHLADGVSRHHKANEQWFNLYVILFLITGVRVISWVMVHIFEVRYDWFSRKTQVLHATVEMRDSILVFLIFVLKDDIIRSFREQFSGRMRTSGLIFRRHSTPNIGSDNENL